MGKLIKFLWMRERFNHLWTLLGIWLGSTAWIFLLGEGTNPAWYFLHGCIIVAIAFRLSYTANVFIDKSHILLPADMSQKYLSLLLFQMPLTVGTGVLGYLLALCCGGASYAMQSPVVPAALLLGCMWIFTLGICLPYGTALGIAGFLTFFYAKGLAFAHGHGVDVQTIVLILLANAIVLLPVSWMVFRRRRYDYCLLNMTNHSSF